MKKLCLLSLAVILLSGCTKNYKSVDEYYDAMQLTLQKNSSYIIEATQETPFATMYYRSYVKGRKWKTEKSMNGGASYMSTVLYDGNELLNYSQGSPYAMLNPAMSLLLDEDEETQNVSIGMQNPIYPLLKWRNILFLHDEAKFKNERDNINGFDCRKISIGDDVDTCVSDKYGVAVYYKMLDNENNSAKVASTLKLVKFQNVELDDSVFDLPEGVRKTDIDSMLNELDATMDKMLKMFE